MQAQYWSARLPGVLPGQKNHRRHRHLGNRGSRPAALASAIQHVGCVAVCRKYRLHRPVENQRRAIGIAGRVNAIGALHLEQAPARRILRLAIHGSLRPGARAAGISKRLIGCQLAHVVGVVRILHKRHRRRSARIDAHPVNARQTQRICAAIGVVHHREHRSLLVRRKNVALVAGDEDARRKAVQALLRAVVVSLFDNSPGAVNRRRRRKPRQAAPPACSGS